MTPRKTPRILRYGRGEPRDPPHGARWQLLLGHGAVPHERVHMPSRHVRTSLFTDPLPTWSRSRARRRARTGPARNRRVRSRAREQAHQLASIARREGAEGRLRGAPPRAARAVEQARALAGERDEDRAAIVGVDRPRDEPERLEVVDHRRRRPGHDLEQRPRCPPSAAGWPAPSRNRITRAWAPVSPIGPELGHRAAMQAARGPHEKLGELSRVLERVTAGRRSGWDVAAARY